jgi:hypothetical protein
MTARVGLIIPSSNRMVEQEMVKRFPQGVHVHITRLRMTGSNHLAFDELLPRVEEATRALVDARCDVVAFHCTANSMEGGREGEEQILATLARAGAPRCTTTITAIQRAFDALDAKRIVLITPYSAATTEHEAEFLQACGYDMLWSKGYALAGSDAYCATPRGLPRQLRQHFSAGHHRRARGEAVAACGHQQSVRDLGFVAAIGLARLPRLSGAVVRADARSGGAYGRRVKAHLP